MVDEGFGVAGCGLDGLVKSNLGIPPLPKLLGGKVVTACFWLEDPEKTDVSGSVGARVSTS